MFAKSLILAASVAHLALAAQEFGILNNELVGTRLLQDEPRKRMFCMDRAKKPGDKCYFKSPTYQAKTAE